jgi:iron complex transport system ATP-binding protein
MAEMKAFDIDVAYTDKIIIKQMSVTIPSGKITTIIGPNGCGKSTLLKAFGRILKTKKGNILISDYDINQIHTKKLASMMALLPQSPKTPEGLVVEELVSFGRYPYQKRFGKLEEADKKAIDWALSVCNLSEIRQEAIENLSGGQRQRVWIAMALAQETDIILLDEPTTYLDMAYQMEVLELLYDLNRNHSCTIVMVLHDINLASKFADHLIAMKDGKILYKGSVEEIMTEKVLREVYDIEATIMKDSKTLKPVCTSYELRKHKTRQESDEDQS